MLDDEVRQLKPGFRARVGAAIRSSPFRATGNRKSAHSDPGVSDLTLGYPSEWALRRKGLQIRCFVRISGKLSFLLPLSASGCRGLAETRRLLFSCGQLVDGSASDEGVGRGEGPQRRVVQAVLSYWPARSARFSAGVSRPARTSCQSNQSFFERCERAS